MTNSGDALMGGGEVDARKLVILGLPWDTTETSLEQYFSQIGPLQVLPHPHASVKIPHDLHSLDIGIRA